jgi:sulfate adenylyltransferase subunit 1 (EFTu-like GTPase family)
MEADVCWMAEAPLRPGARLLLKHTTATVRAVVDAVEARLDVETLAEVPAPDGLELNDLGHVRVRTSRPLAIDPYAENRTTGAFILIDEATNDTVAAGMAR